MIKAMIFDFDGLIIDSEEIQYIEFKELFRRYKQDLKLERWQLEVGGNSGFNAYDYLEELANVKVDRKTLKKEMEQKIHHGIVQRGLMPGVLDYLEEAVKLDLKIGLASSSHKGWVLKYLKQFNLMGYFECIKTVTDVEKAKPDPSLYIETAKCLAVDPSECLVLEDSLNGLRAAKAANMACVVVPNEITKSMNFSDMDLTVNSLSELDLKSLINKLGCSIN